MSEVFRRFAHLAAHYTGSVWAFLIALLVIGVWAVTGPAFGFSDTWQLVINTGTTIVTFLMVFLIQNTQNRDSQAVHAKLNELIRSTRSADNSVIEAEEMTDEQLEELRKHFYALAESIDKTRTDGRRAGRRSRSRAGRG